MIYYKNARLHTCRNDLDSRWYVTYYYLNPETEKLQLFKLWVSSRFKTKTARREAGERMARQINKKLRQGWNPFQDELNRYTSIKTAMNQVIEFKNSVYRKRSQTTNSSMARIFIEWLEKKGIASLYIEQFSTHYAREFMDHVKLERGLANRTYNNYLTALRTLFYELIKRNYIEHNPFTKIEKLRITPAEIRPFTKDQLKATREHLTANDPDMWFVAQLVFYCFLRPAEIVQLRIRNIDVHRNQIIVPPQVSKNALQQVIVIPAPFRPEVRKLNLNDYPLDWFLVGKNLKRGTESIYPTRLAERFRKHMEILGMDRKLYDFKHTGAGMALENGANINDLRMQLRHHSLEITQIYLSKFKALPGNDFSDNFPSFS